MSSKLIAALLLLTGISAHAFQCKVTFHFQYEAGKPSFVDKHDKKAELKVTKWSRTWTYAVKDGDFEIMATRKDDEDSFNAWISDTASGHALLSNVQLANWDGNPLFLSLRDPLNRLVDGRPVSQVNLRCFK